MENETPLQHHKRIVYGKLIDKTLANYDYSELSRFAYGKDLSSDVARREFYGSAHTLKLLDEENKMGVEGDLASELDGKIRELQKERQKFFDQRREYNKLVTVDSRRENLYERLTLAASKLNETIGNMYCDRSDADNAGGERDFSENEAVLVFSDWHYGMTTNNPFNEYNIKICKERVAKVVDMAVQRLMLHQCRRLHIVVLGDLFHGAIHTSARVASEELVCDQIMQVSEILAQSIAELSNYVDKVFVYMTYGNHGRTVQNKNDNIHRDNMERIIPWWLTERMASCTNVEIKDDSDQEYVFVNVAGHDICAAHGDLDGVKSSTRIYTLFNKKYGKDIEYVLLGDKHHRESFEELGITSLLCGSLCGTDDYANDRRLFATPSQLMFIINPRIGLDAEYRIECK